MTSGQKRLTSLVGKTNISATIIQVEWNGYYIREIKQMHKYGKPAYNSFCFCGWISLE